MAGRPPFALLLLEGGAGAVGGVAGVGNGAGDGILALGASLFGGRGGAIETVRSIG